MKRQRNFEKLMTILPLLIFAELLAAALLVSIWQTAGVREETAELTGRLFLIPIFTFAGFLLFLWVWLCAFVRKTKKAAERESAPPEFFDAVEEQRETFLYLYEFIAVIAVLFIFLFNVLQWEPGESASLAMLGLAICLLLIILIEVQMRSLKKRMKVYFPRQKGSPYGRGYGFELAAWMRAGDEGEKMIVYKAAYRTYHKVKAANLFLMVFFAVLALCGDLQPAPAAAAALLWALLNSLFYYERGRLKTKEWEAD